MLNVRELTHTVKLLWVVRGILALIPWHNLQMSVITLTEADRYEGVVGLLMCFYLFFFILLLTVTDDTIFKTKKDLLRRR